MRRIQLLFAAAALCILSAPAFAGAESQPLGAPEGPQAPATVPATSVAPPEAPPAVPGTENLTWDQVAERALDSTAEPVVEAAPEAPTMTATAKSVQPASHGIVLGPRGVDDLGRSGRLHTVTPGNTLWDLAAAYLGTPWVWPSVWIDNHEIANPHLIMPGDKIWITANEMRVVTEAEAESFLGAPVSETEAPVADAADVAGDLFVADSVQSVAALEVEADEPPTLEAFPVSVPGEQAQAMAGGRQITISRRDAMGFISPEDLAGASSIVASPVERTFLAEGDPVVLGMGEGDVEVGDQFVIFEVVENVRDIESNRILGYHVDVMGWLEVKELTGDTSIANVRMSYSEFRRGVRVMRRPMLSRRVTTRSTPDAIEGQIVFLPSDQTVMGDGGYVYLNRGEFHGVEVGSELEVFDHGSVENDQARRVDVRTPDHFVAKLVVVSVMPDSSVAFVLKSSRELEVGDAVRPALTRIAGR